MFPSEGERLAVLESDRKHQDSKIEAVVDRLDSLDAKVARILETMERHTGFFRGVFFTFSLIGAAIGAFGVEIWKKLTSN